MLKIKSIFNKIIFKCKLFYYLIKRMLYPPNYPKNPNGDVFIHLGCGEINSPEFINVDSRPLLHVHHVHDAQSLPFFSDNFADLIYVSHTLEHIPMEDVVDVLKEWQRVLKPGGILRISVPDFDQIINIYHSNNRSIETIWRPLLGGQEYPENYHFSVFNKKYLKDILEEIDRKSVV